MSRVITGAVRRPLVVRGVVVVRSVRNRRVTADELELRVAQTLAEDVRTHHQDIRVRVDRGVMDLPGSVEAVSAGRAAVEIAAGPDVRYVISRLDVSEADLLATGSTRTNGRSAEPNR